MLKIKKLRNFKINDTVDKERKEKYGTTHHIAKIF